MQKTNVRSGFGVERDAELGAGSRRNVRGYIGGTKERAEFLLGLSETVTHGDLVEGDLVSVTNGKIVPLNTELPFAGIIDAVGQNNRSQYIAGVVTRCMISVKLEDVSPSTCQGSPVYAKPLPKGRTVFTAEKAGVLVGEVAAFEGGGRAVVGIRTPEDTRPFYTGATGAAARAR